MHFRWCCNLILDFNSKCCFVKRLSKDELDIEWRNLLLEQNSLTEHSVIESKARKQLNMQKPTGKSEIIIKVQE